MPKAPATPKPGTPEAAERRQLRVDLSGLDEAQRRRRAGLIGLGQTAFGPRWRTELAKAIGTEMQKPFTEQRVAQWVSGNRPVPEAVYQACLSISLRYADDLKRRAAILETRSWTDSREREDGRVYVAEPMEGDRDA